MATYELSFFENLAEERIKRAQERGEFENLAGQGKPLVFDDPAMPDDLKMAYKVLKNAGYVPEEVHALKEINSSLELLDKSGDEHQKLVKMKKLNYLVMAFSEKYGRELKLNSESGYFELVVNKL